jgi:hypothetical protein
MGITLEMLKKICSAQLRQHHVKNNDIGLLLACETKAFLPI